MTRLIDFVIGNCPEGFEESKFSILCEKYPIVRKFDVKVKALYIIFKNKDGKTVKIYPNNIIDPYFKIKETARRKIFDKKKPFWINGDTLSQNYEGHDYFNFSISKIKNSEESVVTILREKYNIEEPKVYEGESLGLEL